MNGSFRLALIMDTGLGWRTNYQNWFQHFPQDMGVAPTWVVLDDNQPHWIDTVPGLPKKVRKRLRDTLLLREGLRRGPFDATFIAVSSALTTLPRYIKRHPCFFYTDATPKQLYDFGDAYGWYPSRDPRMEHWKHQRRAFAYQHARTVFTMSQWAADSVVADYGARPQNLHVLPPGVDLTWWQPGSLAEKAGKDACDLLFVGGDFARKGGPRLLDWAAKTTVAGWRLHLVTPQAVQVSDPRVVVYNDLTPNDPRLRQLYARADVFVLPTRADCSPWAGVEALASGLPLVIGDTGGTGEVVRAGETGYLIGQDDAAGLAGSLEALIADAGLRARLGQAARADAERRFSAPELVREAVQLMMSQA